MREPVTKIIDNETFVFHQLPPKKSLKLLIRIGKIIGAPIGAAAGNAGTMGAVPVLDMAIDLASVASALFDRLDENEVEAIIDGLLSQTRHEGQGELSNPAAFNALFGGNLPLLFKVVLASIDTEYGHFFDGKPVFQGFMEKAAGMIREKQT